MIKTISKITPTCRIDSWYRESDQENRDVGHSVDSSFSLGKSRFQRLVMWPCPIYNAYMALIDNVALPVHRQNPFPRLPESPLQY